MIRLKAIPGEQVDPATLSSVDELVQARIDGRISRRDLMRRSTQLGLTAATAAIILHATSDYAYGAPSHGRQLALQRLQTGETVPVTGPTQPDGTQVAGGTVIAGGINEPDSLHPLLVQSLAGFDIWQGVVEGLLKYDSAQQLLPALAMEISIGEDGLSYTFVLREGVTFHSGVPFTAEDVLETWKIANNPDFATYNTYSFDYTSDVQISEDGKQVTLFTAEPYAPFLSMIGAGAIFPTGEISKGIESFQQEFGRKPIGTGPMMVTEWKASEEIALARYDAYWDTPAILDGVVYRIVPDDNTQLVQLRTGEVQLSGSDGAINALRVDEALGIESISILEHPTQAWKHLDLKNIDHLRVTKVRQALDYATPKQLIIDELLNGRVLPSIGDQAPGTWAHNPDIEPRPYDPDMARQLLSEAGLTEQDGVWTGPTPTPSADIDPNVDRGGPEKPLAIEIWSIAGDSQNELISQAIAQSWNEIGIRTEAKFEDSSTIWGPEAYQFTENMSAGLFSWYNSNDPDSMWYWHSQYIPDDPLGAGGAIPAYFFPFNFQAEIDDLTGRAAVSVDQEERAELYKRAQVLLAEETPVIFLFWDKAFPAVAHNVGGFWPSQFTNLLWNVKDWYLTEQ